MKNQIVAELFAAFSRDELNALRKFLESPIFNVRKDVLRLFELMAAAHPEPVGQSRQEIFREVFGTAPFDARQFNLTASYLLKLMEKFLALRQWESDQNSRDLDLMQALAQRKQHKMLDRHSRALAKRMDAQRQRDADWQRAQYQRQAVLLTGFLQQSRGRDFDFQELARAHEQSFVIEKLRYGCMLSSHQTVEKKEYDLGLLPVLLQFLEGHSHLENPVVAAWYHGYFAQKDPQASAHFTRMKNILATHGDLFALEELHNLYLMAVNFCIRRINSGDNDFLNELFDLYQTGLSQGIFLENGLISRFSYNNIVNIALKTNRLEWAFGFLERYRPVLEASFREATYHFNLARCHYENGDFSSALTSLTHIEYDDVLQNMMAKTLQVKIYYQTGAFQALESLLDSMLVYLQRKKMLGYHKENFSNMVRFMRGILALKPGDKAGKAKLKAEIMDCKQLVEKAWLVENVDH